MKKSLVLASIMAPMLLIGVVACTQGNGGVESEPTTTIDEAVSNGATAQLGDLSKGVEGQVGFRHGMDCTDVSDCSINFTVESLDLLEMCEGTVFGEQPSGTHLVKATVLLETKPSDSDYRPGEFPIWSDWSALDKEGINQELPQSSWCSPSTREQAWRETMQVGDTERRVHIMDVPDGASKIRLTETLNGARWEFPAPDASATRASLDEVGPAQEPGPTPNFAHTPAPVAPAPRPTPEAAPVVVFTGAPGVEAPRVLDKQVSHCGDPQIHQTGTTFFTDGTSGWTEVCSNQMLQ